LSARHHFFVEPGDVHGDTVALVGAEAHHAAHVLRVRPGEHISVADGTGRVLDAVVRSVGEVVDADIREMREVERRAPDIVLVQGIAKADKLDAVVQKAVEVGVGRIVPVVCDRTVVRWDERKRDKAAGRWRGIARAAAKQCRSAWITAVDEVREGFADVTLPPPVVALDADAAVRLRDALPPDAPDIVSVVIGPEGGLSPGELQTLRGRGATVATLGPRILRAETAGPVAAALILYAYGSLG
jgi:16S rRNA (uracil1498-N3)-methyltransferase